MPLNRRLRAPQFDLVRRSARGFPCPVTGPESTRAYPTAGASRRFAGLDLEPRHIPPRLGGRGGGLGDRADGQSAHRWWFLRRKGLSGVPRHFRDL